MITLLALTLIGYVEGKSGWKRYPMIYEVRGDNLTRIYTSVLGVLDRIGERLAIVDRDSVGTLQRVAFVVKSNYTGHRGLLEALKASDAADEVVAFRDIDAE